MLGATGDPRTKAAAANLLKCYLAQGDFRQFEAQELESDPEEHAIKLKANKKFVREGASLRQLVADSRASA